MEEKKHSIKGYRTLKREKKMVTIQDTILKINNFFSRYNLIKKKQKKMSN